MTIQILQYEFLGPIPLMDWGPPMDPVVYLIFSRSDDLYHMIYAGESDRTEDQQFFTKNPNFKCWMEKTASENFTHLAILLMPNSTSFERQRIVDKIISKFKPSCNDVS